MKYFSFKRYKFSTVLKNVGTIRSNFLKVLKIADVRKIYKNTNIEKINIPKLSRFKIQPFIPKAKSFSFLNNKYFLVHFPLSIIFFSFLYFLIPTFYNYDKSELEKVICNNKKIKCIIKGNINYIFYPTPRIKIRELTIKNDSNTKTLAFIKEAHVKLSIKNLLAKEQHKFVQINLKNFDINLNFKDIKEYNNIFKSNADFLPINFLGGNIILFDGKDYIATVSDAVLNTIIRKDSINQKLKGNFINDNLYINLQNKKIDGKKTSDLIIKMSGLNLLIKANYFNSTEKKDLISGNAFIKKDKNKISAIFDYIDNEFIINKSNINNTFIDGKANGKITLFPYFNFNLDVNLNSINFTKLYNYFLSLNKNEVFKINNKINGNLNLSSDKIYSSYNLFNSFESRLKFKNSSLKIEQLLLNMGKLGAADFIGKVEKGKKYNNFKFESNVFVDNQKKFLSKFGIYKKEKIPESIFISGNLDLDNKKMSFYEITGEKKLPNDDINYIEREFNNIMLEDEFTTLFYFPKFKEFVKLVSSE